MHTCFSCSCSVIFSLFTVVSAINGAGPKLHLAPVPNRSTNLDLILQFYQPTNFFTLFGADTLEALRSRPEVVFQGSSSASNQVIPLSLSPVMSKRFFILSEKPAGKVMIQTLDSSAKEQTVVLDAVRITVPAGTLTNREIVRVTTHTPQSASATNLWTTIHTDLIYEMQIGTNTVFDPPLTIEIPYDPNIVNRNLPIEDAVTVALWLPAEEHWALRPSTVNSGRNTLTFQTDHLSFWSVVYLAAGYLVRNSSSGHFKTVYDPAGVSMDISRVPIPKQYWNSEYADIINGELERAYRTYVTTNTFKAPSTPIWVLIDSATQDPTWMGRTGDIYIPNSFNGLESLRQELAHELFHAVQNRYYNVYAAGFSSRIWWHEACADCASYGLVLGQTSPFPTDLTNLFLVQQMTTFNEKHEYGVANILDYVCRNSGGKLNFKTHFTELAGYGYYSTLARFASQVRAKTGRDLHAFYREFAADFLFNKNGYSPGLDPWSIPVNSKNQDTFQEEPHGFCSGYNKTFYLKGGYSAQLLATKIVASKGSRNFQITLNPPTGDALIDVYRLSALRLNARPTPVTLAPDGRITVNDGQYLCFVAVNYNPETDSNISLKVDDDLVNTFKGTTTYQLTGGSPSAFTLAGDWALTGPVVSITTNHPAGGGLYSASITVKTNRVMSFKWNYQLGRVPSERTDTYSWGKSVYKYAQPTIDGKTLSIAPTGNPILQQWITDNSAAVDILFTSLTKQGVTIVLSARPRFNAIDYYNNGQINNQGTSTEGSMSDMYVIFNFTPVP